MKTLREIIEEQVPIRSLIVVLMFIAFVVGYGVWTTANTGTITITSPIYGAHIIIDKRLVGETETPPESVRLSESSGKHVIIVSKDGYWPWSETVELKKHETIELHPFVVPQQVAMENISRTSSEYTEAASLFKNVRMSSEIQPLVEATRIQDVIHADYALERTDVLLIATKKGIFAVGVEQDSQPNFQPVYQGTNPTFAKSSNGTLYIKEGDSILRVRKW